MEIKITSDAAKAAGDLGEIPTAMVDGIVRALDYENEMSVGEIQARKLSQRGPTTLGVITNRLRGSIRPTAAAPIGSVIDSSIGSNVVYAAVHEYGIDQQVQVKGFRRKVESRSIYKIGSAKISRSDLEAILHLRKGQKAPKRSIAASGVAFVKPFTRQMKMPARRYIGSTLEERSGSYADSINKAVLAAWTGGKK